MKLDPTVLRTMHANDFKVLQAVEQGMKNHETVPLPLITSLSNLRHGGAHKIVSSVLRDKLLSHERKNGHDGYRLTTAGYDILALHTLKVTKQIAAFGQKVGTGKESDIYLACDPTGRQVILKFHRLGRTSFRNVKQKRDYFVGKAQQNQAHSWLFLSRLSALKEYAFMKTLHQVQYPTPTPLAHNRHVVVMSLVRGMPLYQVLPKQVSVDQASDIYQQALTIAGRLAKQHGLVHCDLNEFNLLVDLSGVQQTATQDTHDPYVRHAGSVAAASLASMGALSKPAWEQSLEQADDIVGTVPEPVERLENGEPKPVVTLIDFPQMISIQHPNAQELYERDLACLRKFFETKLHCQIPPDEEEAMSWKAVAALSSSTSRLDSELKASGFSDALGRGLELYYFDSGPGGGGTAIISENNDEEGDEEEEDDYDENDEQEAENDADGGEGKEEYDSKDGEKVDEPPNSSEKGVEEDERCFPEAQVSVGRTVNNDLPSRFEIEMDSLSLADDDTAVLNLLDSEQLRSIAHSKAVELAKERVRRQLDEDKRKARRKGAFRKGNKNKTYVKGKRVLADNGL